MEIIERAAFSICGYSIETTAEQNDADVSALYNDFFSSGKESVLLKLHGIKPGCYGLFRYTQGHDKYSYLLGMEIGSGNTIPDNAELKELPETTYAMERFAKNKDIKEAWTEFFFTVVPNAGFYPNEALNLYFEYYPESVHGNYELWVPVVKAE